jgi:hypothetical protein
MKVIYYNEDNRKILETYKDNIPREMDEVWIKGETWVVIKCIWVECPPPYHNESYVQIILNNRS